MRYSLIVVVFALFSFCSCEKLMNENAIGFDMDVHNVHIICDSRSTGVVEPWLFEFAIEEGFQVNSSDIFYYGWRGMFEIKANGSASVEYLLAVPLLDMSNLVRVIEPTTLADKNYKHYEFEFKGFKYEQMFRVKDYNTAPNGTYNVGDFLLPKGAPISIILSTNVPIEEAISKTNAGLFLLSQKKFTHYSN
jgi:hypothetical protein